jgi:CheY-like chemotaxis protein
MPYVPANDPKKIGARTDTWSASRLLIVEDDLINAQYVKEMLAPSRLQIFHAPNGTEAIRHLHEFRPDAMLLDLGLPDLSGYEVAKRAKAMHHDLPIVALTAYDDRETKLKCDEFGFNFFLTKPVSSSTLLATLRIVFQHASQ